VDLKNKSNSLYTEEDYRGDFNLLSAEKELIILALKKNKFQKEACKKLKISEGNLRDKIKRHQIDVKKIKFEKKEASIRSFNGNRRTRINNVDNN